MNIGAMTENVIHTNDEINHRMLYVVCRCIQSQKKKKKKIKQESASDKT